MIDIDKQSFCGLSTSNLWHTFLFDLDQDTYKEFVAEMRQNRGCEHNRKTMEKYYQIMMGNNSYSKKFIEFIEVNFPFMVKRKQQQVAVDPEFDKLFRSNVLTYTRRTIVYNNLHDFVADKLKYDVYNDSEKYYVEYLEKSDMAIADKIPEDKWILSKYKARRQENG